MKYTDEQLEAACEAWWDNRDERGRTDAGIMPWAEWSRGNTSADDYRERMRKALDAIQENNT